MRSVLCDYLLLLGFCVLKPYYNQPFVNFKLLKNKVIFFTTYPTRLYWMAFFFLNITTLNMNKFSEDLQQSYHQISIWNLFILFSNLLLEFVLRTEWFSLYKLIRIFKTHYAILTMITNIDLLLNLLVSIFYLNIFYNG